MANTKKTTTRTNKAPVKSTKQVKENLPKETAPVIRAEKEQAADVAPIVNFVKEEYVTLLFIGAIAHGTSVYLGKNVGVINRAGGTLDIPKRDFLQCLGTPVIDALLRNRSLVVVNGLTDEERERFGVKYEDGELLTQNMYFRIFNYSDDEVCRIFEKLCIGHQRTVAKMFITEYFENNRGLDSALIKRLNDLSKATDKNGMFTPILEDMGKKLAE